MKPTSKPLIRSKDVLLKEMLDETLVYDLENDKAYCLNDSSSKIWKKCDGTQSPGEIAENLSRELGSEVSEEFVLHGIGQLAKDDLLEDNGFMIPGNSGFSRRDMLRRVGLAATVALPVVASMAAPKAAQAQSCIPTAAPCIINEPPECCEGICLPLGSDLPGEPGICVPVEEE